MFWTKRIALLTLFFSSQQAFSKLPRVIDGAPLPSNIFVELNKELNPAVVNISTEIKPRVYGSQGMDPMEELLRQFFGGRHRGFSRRPQAPSQKSRPYSLGTGFIIRKDGLILTNSHVVDKADVIKVQLSEKDKTLYPAKVIGKDPTTDIALIKIQTPSSLPVAKLGKSSNLKVGEWVAAFGNPYGHGHSMTTGVVSAIGRDLDELNLLPFIQTDASINPGNSGGPLVNMKGEVIGVNTAIDARAQGIGFAIPIDEVKGLIQQLEKKGSVERAFLGIEMQDMTPELAAALSLKQNEGAIVMNVVEGSTADRMGLKTYDVITSFNQKAITKSQDLARAVKRTPIGKKVELKFFRNNRSKKLFASLAGKDSPKSPSNSFDPQSSEIFKAESNSQLLEKFGFDVEEISSKSIKEYELKESEKGRILINRVVGYSQAARSGLRPGDIIYDVNRKAANSIKSFKRSLLNKGKKSFLIRVKRRGRFIFARLES